jgi:hypothetical protein
MRRRLLPIAVGMLIATAALAVSIGPAAASRAHDPRGPDAFAAAARAAASKLFRAFPHVVHPTAPGGCSVSSGECVRGCAVPVTMGDALRPGTAAGCEAAEGVKPCLRPVSSGAAAGAAAKPAPLCGPAQVPETGVFRPLPKARRR